MNPSRFLIAEYNATLPTITNGCSRRLQLTAKGILLTTIKDDDGSDVIVSGGEDVSSNTDRGFIAYGINDNDQAQALSIDDEGNLRVTSEGGVNKDVGTDEAGNETLKGVIDGIAGTPVVIAKMQITSGSTFGIEAFDGTCDKDGMFQLVIGDSGSGITKYIRTMKVPETVGFNQLLFPKARKESATNDDTWIKLLVNDLDSGCGVTMNAAGGINAYEIDA